MKSIKSLISAGSIAIVQWWSCGKRYRVTGTEMVSKDGGSCDGGGMSIEEVKSDWDHLKTVGSS